MDKKQRASRPKVRTGCLTCKIRHVKCDEEKPECGQCRKTKRKCDGYDNKLPPNKDLKSRSVARVRVSSSISQDNRLVLRPGTREERQYAEVFCNKTSQAISGFFTSDFWDRLLPQLSFAEPALRHAIVAVGAAHEQHIYQVSSSTSADASTTTPRNEQFILEQYNKAIRCLKPSLSSPSAGKVDSTLILCSLFTFLEIIRGNFPQAFDHIEAGLRMIHDSNKRGDFDAVNRELLGVFSRLNVQKSLFGRSLMSLDTTPEENETSDRKRPFQTLLEARLSLDSLMARSLTFIRSVQYGQGSLTTAQQQEKQVEAMSQLDSWSSRFEQLVRKSKKAVKRSDPRGPLVLRMHYLVSRVWLETCLSPDERVFDSQLAKFEDIVSNATWFTSNEFTDPYNELNDPSSGFCGEMGIIPPVYYTALKCRNPTLRRKAIALLSTYHRREGMWNATQCSKIAEFVVAIEEQSQISLPVEARVLPRVEHRIYEVLIAARQTGNNVELVLFSKRDGVDGDWLSETRFIQW